MKSESWLYGRSLPLLALLSMLLAAALLVVDIESGDNRMPTMNLWILGLGLLALLLLLAAILGRFVRLASQLRRQEPGARLTRRLTIIFLALTVPPALIVYLFSMEFLNETIDDWLNVGQEQALADAIELARVVLDARTLESQRQVRQLTIELQDEINRRDASDWFPLLIDKVSSSGPMELSILDERGAVLASANIDGAVMSADRPRDFTLLQILDNRIYAEAEPLTRSNNSAATDTTQALSRELKIRAAMVIPESGPGQPRRILQGIYYLPGQFNDLAGSIEAAYYDNQRVIVLRDALQLSFVIILTLVLALSILLGILAALSVAQRLVQPLTRLAHATGQVAVGEYHQEVTLQSSDELGFLVRSFNQMSIELERSRVHLEDQRQYLETVLNRLSAGVMSFDNSNHLVTSNSSAANILNIDLQACSGQSLDSLADRYSNLAGLFQRIRERSQQALEWREEINLQQDRQALVLVVRGTRLAGQSAGQVVVFDDVTVLTEAQRQAAWSEVARRLAHEVKNPLTPIRLAAERMGRKLLPQLDAQHQTILAKATSTIVSQVEALQALVNAFADYAQDNRAELQSLDLHQLLDEIISLYQTASDSINFSSDLQAESAMIIANAGRLRQVLHNLIRNAQEAHTAAAISATLLIGLHTRNEARNGVDGVLLVLSDNGPGIDEVLLENVFQPYVSNKLRSTDGSELSDRSSGLGLAIVRKIIDESGGSIMLANHNNGGAVASIWLPMAARVDHAASP